MEKTSNKRLSINMAVNIVSYIGSIGISFVLTPYLINSIGKETYSFYPIANSFVGYMSIVVNALNAVSNRYITVSIINDDKRKINEYFSSTFFSNCVLSIVLLIPMIIIILSLEKFMDIPLNVVGAVKILFSFVFASMIINISTSVFGVATYATNRIDLRSWRELFASIFRLLLFYIIFTMLEPNILYIGVITFIIAVYNLIVQFIFTKKLLPNLKVSYKYFSLVSTRILFVSGGWNILNQLGNMMLSGSSLILANIFYGAEAGGNYSIIQIVPAFMNGVISMLTGIFTPLMTHYYAIGKKQLVLQNIKNGQKLIGIFCCSVIAVFIGLSKEFFQLWVPSEEANYLSVISTIAIIPHTIISTVWPISNLNIIIDKLKIPALYLIISGVLNILLSFISSRIFEGQLIYIIAICSFLQVMWTLFFIPIYPCRYLKIPKLYFYPVIIKTILGTIAGVVITKWIKNYFFIKSWACLIIVGILCGIIVLMLQIILNITKDELNKIFYNYGEKEEK